MSNTTTEHPIDERRHWISRIDKVIAATVLIFIGIALQSPEQALTSVLFVVEALISISPFLAASIGFAALAKASGLDQPIASVFRRNQTVAIIFAALLGSLSPFCSCGVIPIIAGLLQAGVPLAPVMAFWIASPLMDPEMFLLMVGSVGLPFTLAKVAAAASIGLVSGFAVYALGRLSFARTPLRAGAPGCGSSCGGGNESTGIVWAFWHEKSRMSVFADTSRETAWFLGRWLTLAFLIESLMVAFVPAEQVAGWLGGGEWWVVPLSSLVGIPAYLNGYAAIPLVRGLMEVGMLPGAALAFMIAGGVTSIPASMAVYVTVNRGVFAVYLALGLFGAVMSGWIYQAYVVF
jgi:hypothetical protein